MSCSINIDPRIWNDFAFNALSKDAKLLYFSLYTHPHLTVFGAMRASISGLASELGWLMEDFRKALAEIFAIGLVQYDEKALFVWLPNFLELNKPESSSIGKLLENDLNRLPNCELKTKLIQQIKVCLQDKESNKNFVCRNVGV